jgi:hypothetical protein
MKFILLIVMSNAYFLPGSFTETPFETKESCEAALNIAKHQWQTVNEKSLCIDIEKEKQIREAQEKLDAIKNAK